MQRSTFSEESRSGCTSLAEQSTAFVLQAFTDLAPLLALAIHHTRCDSCPWMTNVPCFDHAMRTSSGVAGVCMPCLVKERSARKRMPPIYIQAEDNDQTQRHTTVFTATVSGRDQYSVGRDGPRRDNGSGIRVGRIAKGLSIVASVNTDPSSRPWLRYSQCPTGRNPYFTCRTWLNRLRKSDHVVSEDGRSWYSF